MLWENWIQNISTYVLGVPDANTGALIFSLVIVIIALLGVLLITKGKKADITMSITCCICFIFLVVIGWFPILAGSIIAFVFAFMFAKSVSGG